MSASDPTGPSRPLGLIFAQLDMDAGVEPEFNDWYDTEHIPERLAIPGFVTARRAERAAPAPRYIALYDLDSLAVLANDAYLGKQGDRRTPWTARMLRLTKTFARRLYEQVLPGRELVTAEHAWTVMRFVPHAAADRATIGGYVTALREQSRAVRLYDGRDNAAGEWLVLATAADEACANDLATSSALGRPLDRTEVYGPYVRKVNGKTFGCRTL
jgi:hypothetical protein